MKKHILKIIFFILPFMVCLQYDSANIITDGIDSDTIYGTASTDTILLGAKGTHTYLGGEGDDIYTYKKGNEGKSQIIDKEGNNSIALPDMSIEDIRGLLRKNNDLIILFQFSGDYKTGKIIIKDYFENSNINFCIKFSNGATLNRDDIMKKVITPPIFSPH